MAKKENLIYNIFYNIFNLKGGMYDQVYWYLVWSLNSVKLAGLHKHSKINWCADLVHALQIVKLSFKKSYFGLCCHEWIRFIGWRPRYKVWSRTLELAWRTSAGIWCPWPGCICWRRCGGIKKISRASVFSLFVNEANVQCVKKIHIVV